MISFLKNHFSFDHIFVLVSSILIQLRFQQVKTEDKLLPCGAQSCRAGSCCGDRCCQDKESGSTWYFWVGIAACVLLFLGFLLLCICYLKKSLTATLTLVHNLPNDMVIIRTVQDPNGIIRPEVARPNQSSRYNKPPPADSDSPEMKDSMLPLDPAYPPVRALEANAMRRDSGNIRLDHDLWRSESNSLTNVSI